MSAITLVPLVQHRAGALFNNAQLIVLAAALNATKLILLFHGQADKARAQHTGRATIALQRTGKLKIATWRQNPSSCLGSRGIPSWNYKEEGK